MIKSIIFDLGGVYFSDGAKIAIRKISQKFNLSSELVENALEFNSELGRLYRKGEITAEEFWDRAKKLIGIDADNNYLNKIWMDSYTPIHETIGIIKQLRKKGIKLFFLSDNVKERAEYLQMKYNFLENFIDGVFSYEVHKMKSDGTDIFKLAMDKAEDMPEDIIFVDDKEKYVETARELGMNVICFKSPEQLKEELKNLGVMANPKIPSKQECLDILNRNKTPSNVIGHCKAVCKVAEEVAGNLIGKGIKLNKELVVAAALLHDIERNKNDHINKGIRLLKKMGFPETAEVIKKHGLRNIGKSSAQPRTIEEKIVFYADKRAKGSKIVSIEERFEDLKERYKMDFINEIEFTKKIERELMQ